MGKKVRKKSRGSAKEKRVATHSPKKAVESCNPTVGSVDDGISVVKEIKSCPHLEKGVNLNKISSKIGSSESIRCEECREVAADRRGSKGKGKHGKKKGGAAVDSKSESKAIWVCLECGQYTCGGVGLPINPQRHAGKHASQNRHPLVAHFEKPQLCWCFVCNMFIPVEKIEETDEANHALSDIVKLLKGQSSQQLSMDVEDVLFGDGCVTSKIMSGTLLASDSYGKSGYVVRGMVNLGNTCFFNSIMQNLLAMERLRDNVLKLETPVGPLTSSLKKLFTETNPGSQSKNIINPRFFFGCICLKSPQFRGYQQHDSHELIRCLLDGLSTEELAARKQNDSPKKDRTSFNMTTLVDTLFGGQISSTVCCVECGHSSTVYEPYLDLSLPVPNKKPPPRKAQPVSRTKKTKILPRKGGKTRGKVNRDANPLPVQSLSTQLSSYESSCPAQSDISVAREAVASGDFTVLGYEKTSDIANKEGSSSPNFLAVQDSEHMQVLDNAAENTSGSLHDFTWLDYLEAGSMTYEHDFISQKMDASVMQDVESKDESLNGYPVQASCESRGQVSILNDEQNLRPDSSSGNGKEDEVPLQVQGSEVLLLPYKEESSSVGEVMGRDDVAFSSILDSGQQELEFDGFGDLFNEPEIVSGPSPRPSCGEVMEVGFIAGNNIESDPEEVDHTDLPVSVESCLAHFIKPELLSSENAWHCENCSKILRHQKLEAYKQAKTVTNGNEAGDHDDPCHAASTCPAIVRNPGNSDTKNDKIRESSVSHVKYITGLENGSIDELSTIVRKKENGTFRMKYTHNEELQSSGFHKTCNEDICNGQAANSCSTQHLREIVRKSDPQLLDHENNDSEENKEEEVDSKGVKVKRDATKRVLIYKAPPILTIHLKRFGQDARGRLNKINGHVSFRETIDLGPYMDLRTYLRGRWLAVLRSVMASIFSIILVLPPKLIHLKVSHYRLCPILNLYCGINALVTLAFLTLNRCISTYSSIKMFLAFIVKIALLLNKQEKVQWGGKGV